MRLLFLVRPLRRRAVDATLQHADARAVRRPVLLLVPAPADPGLGVGDLRRRPAAEGAETMFDHLNVVATSVFVFFFALVTVLGFVASRWKAADLDHIHEWGLGGRRFGPWVTWFLLGGDLYTAYTVIAIPGRRLRDRRLRLLRRPLHDHHLSVPLSDDAAAVGGVAQARLHHRRRFRARPLRQWLARAGRRAHRHPRHHALYRAATRRPGEGDPRARLLRPRA